MVIHIYLRLRQEFPVSYQEATTAVQDSSGNVYLPRKDAYYKALSRANTANTSANTQSSACLLLALSQPRRGMSFNADQALGSGAVQDTDNDGINEIVDAWGHPLGFWRWPSQITNDSTWSALFPVNAGKATNPLDPEGLLQSPSWAGTTGQQTFLSLCGGGYSSPVPTRPVVGSAGPDGAWGLDAPSNVPGGAMQPDSTGYDNDNLYSYRLPYGGKGD